jgi:hypothetical protein
VGTTDDADRSTQNPILPALRPEKQKKEVVHKSRSIEKK